MSDTGEEQRHGGPAALADLFGAPEWRVPGWLLPASAAIGFGVSDRSAAATTP